MKGTHTTFLGLSIMSESKAYKDWSKTTAGARSIKNSTKKIKVLLDQADIYKKTGLKGV